MAALEIPGNGDTGHHISSESIQKALDSLDPQRKVSLIIMKEIADAVINSPSNNTIS